MSIVNSITSLILKTRIPRIEHYLQYPWATQMDVFWNLIEKGKFTRWGEAYKINEISSIKQYQDRVPISSYEEFYPYIQRVMKGEDDVLWPGTTRWFSKSSGTTNDSSKYIPVTRESLHDCHFKAGKDLLAIYFNDLPESQLFAGSSLSIGGSHEINPLNTKSSFGDISAVIIENLPMFFEYFRLPSKEVALMTEWEKKIEEMALEVMQENVTNIAGVPTWTLVLFKKIIELHGGGENALLEIWPNLEGYFHGGVNFTPYRSQFEKLLPGKQIRFFETYNASEGFFGLQHSMDSDDMLLLLDYGIFYEFILLEDLGNPHPRSFTIAEVQKGVTYAMVITTNGGLWRYLLGDTIVFTSTSPFKIKVVGRTVQFINAFGEELVVDNAERAIAEASKLCNAEVDNFTAAPIYFEGNKHGTHEWLIEFSRAPQNMEQFKTNLDVALKKLNSDYKAKRYKDLALVAPEIHQVPKGTFYNWMKKRGKLGGQNKVPRLRNDRKYVEDILLMLQPVTEAG